MSRILLAFISSFCLLMAACTSAEGELKKEAIILGRQKWAQVLEAEAKDGLASSAWLQQAYLDYMLKHTEIEVEEVQFQGESTATVALVMTAYPLKLRQTLLGVAAKVKGDEASGRRFNFGDAIKLIGRQTGESAAPEKQSLAVLQLTKKAGHWVTAESSQ